jgi:2-oxoglutarate dehydrogenase E2 component (dihydrolipoamide succinyltransferase)
MANIELIMPKMGESIMEATILKWVKKVGDTVDLDETVLEIATDKVDSEVPSPVKGVIKEILYKENDVVPVGKPIAILGSEVADAVPVPSPAVREEVLHPSNGQSNGSGSAVAHIAPVEIPSRTEGGRFYSPLVRSIARQEGIQTIELETIAGTGAQGRVTKHDILAYVEVRKSGPAMAPAIQTKQPAAAPQPAVVQEKVAAPMPQPAAPAPAVSISGNVEIIEMDRMRKLIADHMVMSKHTSPHVTSFVEVDVTNIVNWREKAKDEFQKKYGEKITFTPIFIEAIVRTIHDFPMINISVDGDKIIRKKYINIGMATALPSGNLIVPVIKNADQLNLIGLTKQVNDLAARARANKLKPEDIQDGTFTLTNVGTFGNVMGTPIINQPQAAIMATGAIRKKPAVVETEYGDVIAIRQMMFLSMSYDHRVVDGFLGGSFLRRVADYLEQFDPSRPL